MCWLELLRDEVGKSNITQAAEKVGVSRTGISLALAGKYRGKTDRLQAKVLNKLADRVMCPHMGHDLARDDCRSFASAPMPSRNARRLRHWSACRNCPQNPLNMEIAK